MKKICITILLFTMLSLTILTLVHCTSYKAMNNELKQVRTMPIKDVDLLKVSDGQYRGSFSYAQGRAEVEVAVYVSGQHIDSIAIIKGGMNKHGKKAEIIVNDIVKQQTPNVDAITGATTTSKAICKAAPFQSIKRDYSEWCFKDCHITIPIPGHPLR